MDNILDILDIEYLQDNSTVKNLKQAFANLQKAQEVATAYLVDDSPEYLKQIQVGTTLAFSIVTKLAEGKAIKSFTAEDWIEIANTVADYAILEDGQMFSVRVFETYADYVDISVKVLQEKRVREDKCNAISMLSKRVRELKEELISKEISEVKYTEDCLWILLESMIKLLTTYATRHMSEEVAYFIESVSTFAFEYGRYQLYKQEQAILTLYLERQCQLDEELEDMLAVYKKELQRQQDEFNLLMQDAFNPDFDKRLKSAASVARNAGVAEEEILDSIDDIDDYFG